jgi:hypothetical protein
MQGKRPDEMLLHGFIAPLGLAMLFSASISLAYLIFRRKDPNVQTDALILFGVLFFFIGIRLLLPHDP